MPQCQIWRILTLFLVDGIALHLPLDSCLLWHATCRGGTTTVFQGLPLLILVHRFKALSRRGYHGKDSGFLLCEFIAEWNIQPFLVCLNHPERAGREANAGAFPFEP